MNRAVVIEAVRSLNLPLDSFIVFGSAPMTVHGIREANDIDLFVTSEVLKSLKDRGWKKVVKGPRDEPYTHGVYEAHDTWEFSKYSPTLSHLQATSETIEGIPFASLLEVRKWKAASTKLKFKRDVVLIDEYLSRQF